MTPDLTPCPKNRMDMWSNPWLLLKFAWLLIADFPVKASCLNPSHFATTEFTPSHPTKTYRITALILDRVRDRIPHWKMEIIAFHNNKYYLEPLDSGTNWFWVRCSNFYIKQAWLVLYLDFEDGSISKMQQLKVAWFFDRNNFRWEPDCATWEFVCNGFQQQLPLHTTNFVVSSAHHLVVRSMYTLNYQSMLD